MTLWDCYPKVEEPPPCNKMGGKVYLLSKRKKRVSHNWIRGINLSLIEGEQPNFYPEKYPFFLQQFSSSPFPQFVSRPVLLQLLPNACLSWIQTGFKSSYQNATPGSIIQCGNLHARQRVGSCDVKHNSRSGGCEPELICLHTVKWFQVLLLFAYR